MKIFPVLSFFVSGLFTWVVMYYTIFPQFTPSELVSIPEAEFLDVIGTKVLRVFLLGIHSQLY